MPQKPSSLYEICTFPECLHHSRCSHTKVLVADVIPSIKLGRAYETLKDERKRRAYDLIYPRLKSTHQSTPHPPPPQPAPRTPCPNPAASASEQVDTNNTARIAAIEKSKQERASRWAKTRKIYDDAIFELNRDIRKLQTAIRDIDSIGIAEAAEEAAAKSWSRWILSPLYKKPVETEELKERKMRERIQRLHNKSFKETCLERNKKELLTQKGLLKQKQEEFEDFNRRDDRAKYEIEERIRLRRLREQMEKERAEQEARDKAWRARMRQEREWEEKARKERELREKLERDRRMKEYVERKKKEEAEEAARAKREEEIRKAKIEKVKKMREEALRVAKAAKEKRRPCIHDGWWPKAEGWMACENCSETYRYLLKCPNCSLKACASCQRKLRPQKRNRDRVNANYREAYGYHRD
jgi:hypothetical protein